MLSSRRLLLAALTIASLLCASAASAVPPTVTINSGPTNPSTLNSASFTFSASEPSTFECKLDGGSFASCVSPKAFAGLADGAHTFSVKATNAGNETGGEATHTWTIDTVAPAAPVITGRPTNPSNIANPSFAFSAESGSTFSCRVDAAPPTACTSPFALAPLADGPHTFAVRAIDPAGNAGPEATYAWAIDTVPPTVSISTRPGNPSNDNTPTFAFAANESGSTFSCRVDATSRPCTSGAPLSNVPDGTHTFGVKATDRAGNTGAEATYTWTVDTVAPAAPVITGRPTNPSNIPNPSFAFSAESGGTSRCRVDAAPPAACTSPFPLGPLADGPHTFAVRVTDAAGNPSAESAYAWTIDTVPPPPAVIAGRPSNPSNNRSPSFTFTPSDGGTLCRLDAGAPAPCTSPLGYSDLGDGPHTFGVKTTDPAGNASAETTYTWTIETRAPTAALISTPSGLSNSSAATFAFSADEPAGFDCKLDGGGFDPCSSPATYYGLGSGAHVFSVRARDAVGNLSAAVAYSWAIDTIGPETTLSAAPKSGTSTSASFTFSASEGGTFECRLDGSPFAVCSSPMSYNGLSRADHQFEVRAIDAAGNADATPSLHAWKITAPVAVKVASALKSPKAGARVKRPPLLVWRRVAGARYYNVQIFRGRRKVFSGWPVRPRLQLQKQWKYVGQQERLSPGRYRWFIWPGYTNPRRYGALLGQSTFVVTR